MGKEAGGEEERPGGAGEPGSRQLPQDCALSLAIPSRGKAGLLFASGNAKFFFFRGARKSFLSIFHFELPVPLLNSISRGN